VLKRRASLRLRLTLSYGLLFFVVGFLLLGLSYLLLRHVAMNNPSELTTRAAEQLNLSQAYLEQNMPPQSSGQQTVGAFMRLLQDQVLSQLLHALVGITFLALAIATAVSVAAGWLMAGRQLRPVHEISAVARRLSASTLHERIALTGPKDELRELADTFDAMLVRLETAFVAQREFVSNASHELRTPLAIMRTELDVTLADPSTNADDLRKMAETIRAAIARSEDVIDKLLVLAESDNLEVHATVDLERLVNDVVERHARAAKARGISIRVAAQRSLVDGDAALLERLVENLVDNSVRYAPEDSEVHVRVAANQADLVTLSVANEGDVISPDEAPRLFERFYRRGTSRSRRSGGSGLGLAIVASVAEVHGGAVSAEAPPEGGLIVTVTLPRSSDPTNVRITIST
jgi:signal transduction histidine kinase